MTIAALGGYRLKKSGDDTGRELLCRVIANANIAYGNLVVLLISHDYRRTFIDKYTFGTQLLLSLDSVLSISKPTDELLACGLAASGHH